MRRLVIVVVVLLILLGVAHALWWRWAEQQLAAGLTAALAGARKAGWTVTAAPPVQGGWPLSASLTVPDLFLSGGQTDAPAGATMAGTGAVAGGVTWSTDRLVIEVGLLQPRVLRIESEGTQRLRVGNLPEIPYTADILRLAIPLQVGVPPRSFTLHMVNLRAGLPPADVAIGTPPGSVPAGFPAGGPAGVTVRGLDLVAAWTPAAQQNEPAVTLSLSAQEIRLPAGRAWPLGPGVEDFSADLALNGPLPRLGSVAARAAAWRDAGGTLEVQRLVLAWGALDLTGSATLALDDQRQPMGAGTIHITDPEAALDGLHANGALGSQAELAAKGLLSLMLHPAEDGGKPSVELPFALQDRRLSISRYGVARFPPLSLP